MFEFVESASIWLPGVGVMSALILCSAFFSSSETAFFFLSRERIRRFSAGNSRQRLIAALMENPDRLLTGVLFWNLLINLTYFAVGLVVIGRLTDRGYPGVAAAAGLLNLVGMIVFGEVIPKSVAVAWGSRVAELAAWSVALSLTLLDPLIPVLGRSARILRRTFWPHVKRETQLKPQDLEQALDTSAAHGRDMLQIEQHALHNVLDLNELRAEEIMRPRSHCVTVPVNGQLNSTPFPTVRNLDYLLVTDPAEREVCGAISLDHLYRAGQATFGELAEPVVYVPWCATLAHVLTQLESRFRAVAVVVHEHGEMVGVVTYEDLIAIIVSETPSRTRRMLRREPLIEIDSNRYHAEGIVTLRYLGRRLRVTLSRHDETLYTLAGLFQDRLKRIPRAGDQVDWHGWVLTVIEATDRGLVRALAEPLRFTDTSEEPAP